MAGEGVASCFISAELSREQGTLSLAPSHDSAQRPQCSTHNVMLSKLNIKNEKGNCYIKRVNIVYFHHAYSPFLSDIINHFLCNFKNNFCYLSKY